MSEQPLEAYQSIQAKQAGQDVRITWFPAHDVPEGKPHGSAGICVTDSREIVLITQDGKTWGFPGGRPEGDETWEETMCREVREEACVEVKEATLLGFNHWKCVRGHEKGLVLVRSLWSARVDLLEWLPEPDTLNRKLVTPGAVLSEISPDPFVRLHHRALIAAGLLS